MFDLLVVGGGPAGTAAAFRAKELGLAVQVIDRDDVLTRIRDYAKGKAILPDFGGGDKMAFPDGGPLIQDLHFQPIDKDAMHVEWKALYGQHGVPARVGVELISLTADGAGIWDATVWDGRTKTEDTIRARHVCLAMGGGMPRRLDIPGDVKSIAARLDDATAYIGGPVCVVGGGTSSAEAVIAIAHAKSDAGDRSPVCWAYRGTTLPAVSRALADELFTAYTQCGNIRYLPGGEPVSVTDRSGTVVLSMEVDRKDLPDRPAEILHLEFETSRCIACIGQEIPEKFLGSLGIAAVVGGPRNKKAFLLSPLLETARANVYLIGDTISPMYLEADDFEADPAQFREVKRRGNVKAALRDGVLVADVVAQKLEGKTSIHVNLHREPAVPNLGATAPSRPGAAPPAATPGQACLVSLLSDGTVEADEFALKSGAATSIGRRQCDVCFPDDTLLADRHASITQEPGGYMLRDEGGEGVFLRVAESRTSEVEAGAVVNVGQQWLVLDLASGPGFTHYPPDGRAARRHALRENATLSVGRDADVSLDAADTTLSRRHASLTVRNGVISVRDLRSANGTFLKVAKPRRLEDGDEIRVGSRTLRFSLSREPRPKMDVTFEATPPPVAAAKPDRAQSAGAPTVTFEGIGKSCPLKKGQSLCEVAEANGVRIKAQCHEGRCGSDPIRIVSGREHLNQVTDAEASTLEELGFEAGEHRLACVTRPAGSVVVELLDPA